MTQAHEFAAVVARMKELRLAVADLRMLAVRLAKEVDAAKRYALAAHANRIAKKVGVEASVLREVPR